MRYQRQVQKVVLFDLDNTLVDVGNQHLKGLRTALRAVYGIDGEPDPRTHSGNTQPNIIRMVCQDRGVNPDVIEARLARAIEVQSRATVALLDDDLRSSILPGVDLLLNSLEDCRCAMAIVTGTVRKTARVILERTGLQSYFPVGAFGDEAEERCDLLCLAMGRALGECSLQLGDERLVVIGDAPRDIQAGRVLSAKVVAVATGYHAPDVLAQHNPDVILPDLGNLQAALGAILGSQQGAGTSWKGSCAVEIA